jgi:hypothetical protein
VAPGRIRIGCISRTPRDDPWERVESVGGVGPAGTSWQLTRDDAVARVEDGTYDFYIGEGRRTVDVIIATHGGHRYLKTVADDEQPDDLLSLPECP